MSKHTPTPWHVVANLVQGARKPSGDSRTVAMVGSGAEDDANAEFIVLACNSHADLLAACEAALASEPCVCAEIADTASAGSCLACVLFAAVAKARGE